LCLQQKAMLEMPFQMIEGSCQKGHADDHYFLCTLNRVDEEPYRRIAEELCA
jgi:hypothetical protein